MFEGKLPRSADELPQGEQDGESLRMLNWDDLVARLAAARELREAFAEGHHASFDESSARCIAAQHNGNHAINPEPSGYGKPAQGMAAAVGHGAASGVARD